MDVKQSGKENMEDLPEADLVLNAQRGDVEAFTRLAERCQARIYHMIMRMVHNHCDAADLIQETFLQAYQSLSRFKRNSSFYTWAYRIAVNLTLNFLKKNQRDTRRRREWSQGCLSDGAGGKALSHPEKQSLDNELKSRLERAIGSLPAVYRATFLLVELEGLSHRQAAWALKCSENTISWRMHRARKMLQAKLNPDLRGGRS